jgi:hypothetical protein
LSDEVPATRSVNPVAPSDWALHPDAAWAERANFVANVDLGSSDGVRYEQLLFRKGTEGYSLLCTPFYAYGYSLADTLDVDDLAGTGHVPSKVVIRGEWWSMRALVRSPSGAAELSRILHGADAMVETRGNLVAFAVRSESTMRSVRGDLDRAEARGGLHYETVWQ